MSRQLTVVVPFVVSLLISTGCADLGTAGNTPAPRANPSADYSATAQQLRKAAEEGNPDARNRLGTLYSQGLGVPQSYVQSKLWFEKAAEQGHAGAQVNLGTLYLHGNGAPESDQMALFWFRRAAEQSDALAFAKLGLMYAQGRGVPQDFVQAHKWYNLSAANGEKRASESRDTLAKQMTPAQVAEAQRLAREWKPKSKDN